MQDAGGRGLERVSVYNQGGPQDLHSQDTSLLLQTWPSASSWYVLPFPNLYFIIGFISAWLKKTFYINLPNLISYL